MDSNIKKWRAKIVKQHKDLEKQMAEVKAQYPLVALAYYVERAILADILVDIVTMIGHSGLSEKLYYKKLLEYRERKSKRERCLGTAKNWDEATQCLQDNPIL